MITKFREFSGKSLIKDEHSLWYHIQDGTFQETKWLAIENGYNNGLTFKEILSKIRVNYNKSNGFEEYHWTQEPHESWDELIKNHALYFRDNYTHLSILFSGGQDSNYILNTFLNNKIKVDEIIVYRSQLPGFDNKHVNSEPDTIALPYLRNLDMSDIGNPIVTIHNIDSWKLMDQYLSLEWSFKNSSNLLQRTPMNAAQMTIPRRPGNSVMLRGTTEPCVYYDKKLDKFYAQIWDTDNHIDGHQTKIKTPFFTSPEYPKIHAKQCHMVKNWLRKNNSFINILNSSEEYKTMYANLVRGGANKRINTKSPFFNKKSGGNVFTEKKSTYFVKQLEKMNKNLLDNYLGATRLLLKGAALTVFPQGVLGVNFGKFYLE